MPSFSVREIQCKSAINRVKGMPFEWSINPYRGCRHACVYCYARPTHEYLGLNGQDEFEEVIFAKVNAPEVVRHTLAGRNWHGDDVVIGTATDPYQQAESSYTITRRILEVFRDFRNPVSITTKSPMILRDLDILAELARFVPVTVHMTVTSLDERLWRRIEPTTAKPRKRLEAIQTLRRHGIRAGVFLCPVLPGITDSEDQMEAVVAAAGKHSASFLYADVLRLGPGITEYYIPFVKQHFPELADQYQRMYGRDYAPMRYRDEISARVTKLKKRHGFYESPVSVASTVTAKNEPKQLSLFGGSYSVS